MSIQQIEETLRLLAHISEDLALLKTIVQSIRENSGNALELDDIRREVFSLRDRVLALESERAALEKTVADLQQALLDSLGGKVQ